MMSPAEPLPTDSPAAVRVGADLRAARERLGWSLEDLSRELNIRYSHLEALEEGQLASLPGNAYAIGFIRSYARAVGLDAEEMVRRVKVEAAEVSRRTELVFPAPMPDRGLPAGAVVLLGLVLSIGAYVGWYRLSGEGRLPAETVAPVPERLAPLAEQAVPPAPQIAAPAVPPPAPDAADVQVATRALTPALLQPSISPTSAAAAPVPEPPPTEQQATGVPVVDGSRIVLHANADSWLQVKDRTGAILLNRTMKAGETWPVPKQDNLLLTTGNAGGTEIVVDGATTPSLGASGAVRRDLPLDPDLIKEGKLAPGVASQLASSRARQ